MVSDTARLSEHWVLTAITETIAWDVLSVKDFQRTFRQDMFMNAMFRNFMLAMRVMKSLRCTPVSHPALPASILTHTLWQSWDLVVDQVVCDVVTSMWWVEEWVRAAERGLRSW